jgi:phenylacetate-CoA ligase
MYQLALHVAARPGPRDAFRVFESSGELFANHQRDTIARVFRCDIVDRYGLAEIGIAAYQAGLHDLAMVVVDPVAWPEIVETDSADAFSPPHEGRFGELVLTATKNRMMPLIRYRTGDMAVLSETPRGFILDKLVGRTHDIVEIGGHRLPTHYIQDLLNRIGGINEFQIERGGEQLVLRVVSDDDANIDEIRDRIGRYWQGAIDVEFIAASELRLLGGRLKFCRIVPHQTAPQDSPFRQND